MSGSGKQINVSTLLADRRDEWKLDTVAGSAGLDARTVVTPDINRPGMALAGYTGVFLSERIQIVGSTELTYLATLGQQEREKAVRRLFDLGVPCVIVTKQLDLPDVWTRESNRRSIPLIRTPLDTTPFIHLLTAYLDYRLAPETHVHGDLVDVFGVGVLITGESGIGKSECALDLVHRGHRLVADDSVRILRRGTGILMGYSAAPSPLLGHHIEVRGVGIVDIYSLFGVRAIRIQKRVEVVARLVEWKPGVETERAGLDEKFTEMLDVKVPEVIVPVVPGKNLALVLEVVAKNHILKVFGYYPARVFNDELVRMMSRSPRVDPFINEDLE
jgi:HPr kinase/phosphorylase